MKAFASARWGAGYQSVYLLPDRIEVGTMTAMYVEELRRVAYRDVRVVTTWRTHRPLRFVLGGLLIAGIAFVALLLPTLSPAAWIIGAPLVALGGAMFWWGREGSVLRFRIEGTRGAVDGAIVGSSAKQERFVADLTRRIAELGASREIEPPAG